MQLYTSDKTSPRSFKWLWFIRLVALVITMIVLGITASNTATFYNIGCDAPARLLYNLAVVCPCSYPRVAFPLILIPSRSSPSSPSSTSSLPQAQIPRPGSFHGSYGVNSSSMHSSFFSGSLLARPPPIVALTCATLAASRMDMCISTASLAAVSVASSTSEIIHRGQTTFCSRGEIMQGTLRLWVDR